ncbi:MAG: DUF4442 domain-containing protein, partial [Solirubrobacteraceae bacterium]|nr:DUF4442 domain-containing protein [Solirubrobacteraceae bacterium]
QKIARGDITATGRCDRDAGELFAELEREGRVRFPIAVELTDADGTVVCEMSVQWYVKPKG